MREYPRSQRRSSTPISTIDVLVLSCTDSDPRKTGSGYSAASHTPQNQPVSKLPSTQTCSPHRPQNTQQVTPQQVTPQQATPQQATPQQATPQQATPQQATPQQPQMLTMPVMPQGGDMSMVMVQIMGADGSVMMQPMLLQGGQFYYMNYMMVPLWFCIDRSTPDRWSSL